MIIYNTFGKIANRWKEVFSKVIVISFPDTATDGTLLEKPLLYNVTIGFPM